MHGNGVIVLRLANHGFFEHETIEAAEREAARLVEEHLGDCVVYVPVRVVRPAPRTVTEGVWTPSEIAEGERLPF